MPGHHARRVLSARRLALGGTDRLRQGRGHSYYVISDRHSYVLRQETAVEVRVWYVMCNMCIYRECTKDCLEYFGIVL